MATTPNERPGAGLGERLRSEIRTKGPITFAEFMEAALYDPDEGFYSRLPVGEGRHFVTSPHLSSVFGRLVARQVVDFWERLHRPAPFDVVEVGAGDGTLAGQILRALPDELTRTIRYTAVDRSLAARTALADRGLAAAAGLDHVAGPRVGCVIANELLDNLPFHRVRGTAAGPCELYVGLEGDDFALVEGPLSSGELQAMVPSLKPEEESVVNRGALDFVDRGEALLERGYVWVIDYGSADTADTPSVHGYRDHRVHPDVLADPGSTDITAGVDFAALARHAAGRGLRVWGPVTQRDALLALGFHDIDEEAQRRQVEALDARRGLDAIRIYSDRNRANLLLGREGLGAAWVLCLGKGADGPPRSIPLRP
jgi:NADH dehydrogenase [ubiquinone] 1 alpha subcomplex assembly factor 7